MLLIAAAVIEELSAFLALSEFESLGSDLYRHRQADLLVSPLGIGMVDSAYAMGRLLDRFTLQQAVFTGSCGVYPAAMADFPLGSLVAPALTRYGDSGEARSQAFFPERQVFQAGLNKPLCKRLGAGADRVCLTLPAITKDRDAAVLLENFYGAAFEQMEAFAFARVCAEAGLPAAQLLVVANEVGPSGHQQWIKYAAAGAQACAECLWEWLGAD